MKRVKAACIIQTLHFELKDDIEHDVAVKLIDEEVAKYKNQLNRTSSKYKILSEKKQEDGSVFMEIKKQYNTSPVGDYMK